MTQGLGQLSAAATSSSEYDRIMADGLRAEAQAISTGQGPIDEAAHVNEMIAMSAALRDQLQGINLAQTDTLRSLAHD
jgi:hypothetical protein